MFKFLRSLWGLLATAAILFPGAAALLKVPIAVENSRIAALYPTLGVILSSFALLFLTAYKDRLSDLALARKWAISSFTIALIMLFSFVSLRVCILDVDKVKRSIDKEHNVEIVIGKERGFIFEEKIPLGESKYASFRSKQGDPWDILGLIFFTGTFATLTLAFGSLGLHVYKMHENEELNES
jgi:hypothetical protein